MVISVRLDRTLTSVFATDSSWQITGLFLRFLSIGISQTEGKTLAQSHGDTPVPSYHMATHPPLPAFKSTSGFHGINPRGCPKDKTREHDSYSYQLPVCLLLLLTTLDTVPLDGVEQSVNPGVDTRASVFYPHDVSHLVEWIDNRQISTLNDALLPGRVPSQFILIVLVG